MRSFLRAAVLAATALIVLLPPRAALTQFLQSDLVSDVRVRSASGSYAAAEAELNSYKSRNGLTPEYLEALSWMARGAAEARDWERASGYAGTTRTLAEQLLSKRKLDSDSHLPVALGAAYEVLAQAMEATGKHAQAVALLRAAVARYANTSIRARLQKNLNLIALVGQPAPALQEAEYFGPKPATLAALKGSPVLLFFWAHWCSDCKAEVPVIARLRQEFAAAGLVVLGPTKLYGYAAQGADAAPAQEKEYIEAVRQRYYSSLLDVAAPISGRNFDTYGVSTTPTLVVVNREGRVGMYHPGAMSYSDLRAAVEKAAR